MSSAVSEKRLKVRKIRSPKLTRLEKLTKGLLSDPNELKARFTIKEVEGKGRGVFLKTPVLRKDSFVLEYEGDIISEEEAQSRERVYAHNNEGCFIMSFTFGGAKWAIDATRRFDSYTRLLNHSRRPNIRFHPPILTDLNGRGPPRIAAYALRDIFKGEEIVFDYGVQDGEIKWLRNRDNGYMEDVDGDSSSDESGDANSPGECDMTFTILQGRNVSPPPSSSSTGCRSEQTRDQRSPDSDVDREILKCKRYRDQGSSQASTSEIYPINYTLGSVEGNTSRGRGKRKFCVGEWGLSFTRVPPGSKQNRFLAGCVNLGTPQKIMRCVEDGGRKKQRSDDESVIFLSSSSENSLRVKDYGGSYVIPTAQVKSAAVQLPSNVAPDSINKVLEWQIPHTEEEDTLTIKIAKVQSLSDHLHAENISPCGQTLNQENSSNYAQTSQNTLLSQRQQSIDSICSQGPSNSNPGDSSSQYSKVKPKQYSNQHSAKMTESGPKFAANEIVDIDSSESDHDDCTHSLIGLRSTSPEEAASVDSSLPPSAEIKTVPRQDLNVENVLVVSESESDDSFKTSKSNCGRESSEEECEIIRTEGPSSNNQHLPVPARRQVAVVKPFPPDNPPVSNEETSITQTEFEHLRSIFGSYITPATVSHEDIQDTIYRNWDFFKGLIERGISVDKIRRTVRDFFSSKS